MQTPADERTFELCLALIYCARFHIHFYHLQQIYSYSLGVYSRPACSPAPLLFLFWQMPEISGHFQKNNPVLNPVLTKRLFLIKNANLGQFMHVETWQWSFTIQFKKYGSFNQEHRQLSS